MNYQFIEQMSKKAVTVSRLCRVLGVSRSGYYGFCQRAKGAPKACLISTQLKAEFAASAASMAAVAWGRLGKEGAARRACAGDAH